MTGAVCQAVDTLCWDAKLKMGTILRLSVKVGDLVRFHAHMHMPGCLGIVVALNGEAFDVQWTDERSRRHAQRGEEPEISAELPQFLEVISESR